MQTVASIQIIREPEQSMALKTEDKSIGVYHSKENATKISDNPLAMVLNPQQLKKYGIEDWNYKQSKYSPRFDEIHDQLQRLIEARDFKSILESSEQHTSESPSCKTDSNHGVIERKSYEFFVKGSKSLSKNRISNFLENLNDLGVKEYASGIAERIDSLKSEVLFKKIIGTLGDKEERSLGKLRAEIGLAALLTEAKKNSRKKNPDYPLTKHLVQAEIRLPSFSFDTNACGSKKAVATNVAESPLARRMEKHANANSSHTSEEASTKCKCDCGNPECKPADKCCADINYYITDLLELREETYCYKAGDLAYIENIAPFETRERQHTFRKEIVDYSEEETTESRSEERDHQVTDRSSVQKEIEKQMSASLDVDAKVTGGTYTVDTSASLSRDTAQREAREKFREMVTKAVQKIQTQTRKLQTRQVTTESAETNLHRFKNKTSEHQVAKYFYATQVKKGQVYSHGQRLMLEIFLPSPAAVYLDLEERKAKNSIDLAEPIKPNLTPPDISPSKFPGWTEETKNYETLWEHIISTYGLTELPKPPPDQMPPRGPLYTGQLNPGNSDNISLPAGYKAYELYVNNAHVKQKIGDGIGKDKSRIALYYGNSTVEQNAQGEKKEPLLINKSGPATLKFTAVDFHVKDESWVQGRITLIPIQYDYSEWQQQTLLAIMEKYETDLAEYNRLLEEERMRFTEERKLMHPFAAEEHMRTQIKQAAIFMMCDDLDDNVMNMKTEPCGYPTFFRKATQEATSRWYFFDRAFDWKLAEFIFFDYFRNPICKWEDTFDPDEPNFLFKSFLRAGYARLQLPVAPGMEADVMAYLQDGTFWNGDTFPPSDPNDTRYQSVVEELKHSYNCNQNDRIGKVRAKNGSPQIEIICSDFYLEAGTSGSGGIIDDDIIDMDMDREVFINGVPYRITGIQPLALPTTDPDYDPDCWNWILSLERGYEGADDDNLKHAIGAKFIGDRFFFDLPTDLVWLGDMEKEDGTPNKCLPCNLPIKC